MNFRIDFNITVEMVKTEVWEKLKFDFCRVITFLMKPNVVITFLMVLLYFKLCYLGSYECLGLHVGFI